MKKIKLDSKRLQLKKEKIANLTDEVKLGIFGGNASAPTTTGTCNTAICTGICTQTCHSKCDECEPTTGFECTVSMVFC